MKNILKKEIDENKIYNYLNKSDMKKWSGYQNKVYKTKSNLLPINTSHVQYLKNKNNKIIIDVGGGDGQYTASFGDFGDKLYLINPDYTGLLNAKERKIKNMDFICAFGEELPFDNNFADVVINIFVVEHIKNIIPLLKELNRICKKDGQILLTTDTRFFCKYIRPFTHMLLHFNYNFNQIFDPTHINLMTPSDLRNDCKKAGIKIEFEDIDYFIPKWLQKIILKLFGQKILENYFSAVFTFICTKG